MDLVVVVVVWLFTPPVSLVLALAMTSWTAQGQGFRYAMKGLDGGRINIATCSVGAVSKRVVACCFVWVVWVYAHELCTYTYIRVVWKARTAHAHPQTRTPHHKQAQACLERARNYVLERKQFGRALADNQHVQFKLADMATHVVTARCVGSKLKQQSRSPRLRAKAKHLCMKAGGGECFLVWYTKSIVQAVHMLSNQFSRLVHHHAIYVCTQTHINQPPSPSPPRLMVHHHAIYASQSTPLPSPSPPRLMVRQAAALLDAKDPSATTACAMAKRLATDLGFQVSQGWVWDGGACGARRGLCVDGLTEFVVCLARPCASSFIVVYTVD